MQLSSQLGCQLPVTRCKRAQSAARPVSRQTVTVRATVEAAEASGEVSIRRRPPLGKDTQPCGPAMGYKVGNLPDINQPINILEEIVWYKAKEIESFREKQPLPMLQALARQAPPARDFKAAILAKAKETGKPGLIAEVKKASPSKGVIQPNFDPVRIAAAYEAGGAACLSVLTDEKFFQGSFDNLAKIKAAGVSCPLLCKEFIVEAYQIFKARVSGADAVLLIAAVLPNQDLAYFMKACKALGMCCLIEVHTEAELARVLQLEGLEHHLLGINNRDLGTFKVDLALTQRIMESPAGQEVQRRGILMVGESGIFTPDDVAFCQAAGVGAILVGEALVKQGDPTAGVKKLLSLAMQLPTARHTSRLSGLRQAQQTAVKPVPARHVSAGVRRRHSIANSPQHQPGLSVPGPSVSSTVKTPILDVSAHVSHNDGLETFHTGEVPFQKILCANRGEIAIRVFRAGTELGLRTVAVYSPADRLQSHRYNADESYQVGNSDMQPVSCYLDIEAIIKVAKEAEVDAIHPGYGFLSENTTFARRCEEEGIVFIGPKAETIEAMGDKTAARRAATACGVPIVPGTNQALESAEEALAFAEEAGYPVILKASMGGGGRGMRVVRNDFEMVDLFNRASNEAKAAFGDGSMFVEKYVEEPRHIEIQIIADSYGNVVHLYERDCSVQRRHQKVVEIAPAPSLAQGIKDALYADAVKLAKHVGYRNAGTVEFMVDKHGKHYFLEVNPRVQVEHTVTEEITGIDIVQTQIKIAGGASLAELGLPSQAAVPAPKGYAIQCRVTSEDPEQNFQPDSGRLEAYRPPGGPGIRLDSAVTAGNVISRYYDSLLSKVISTAPTFDKAVQRMARALQEFQIRGIKTNIPFMENVLRHPVFLAGAATTGFIETHSKELFKFEGHSNIRANKLLLYLADMVVNGPDHPGAIGAPPSKYAPPPPSLPADLAGQPLHGWREVYLREGPEGWAKAVRAHQGLLLTDTTMRDAHQSLLATRMRTHDMLKAAPATAHILAGAGSLEMWGGATFDVALRFLHECPWRRLEQLREQIPNIPFQMLLRGANAVGYTSYPDNVVDDFCRQARVSGIDIFRVFDSLNYIDNLKFGIDSVAAAGGIAEGTICYTGDLSDPSRTRYTLDYYMDLAEQMVDHGIHSLGIKDMAGLLKPKAATELVGALRARYPDLVIHVHTHDSAGTAVATQIAAAEAGADIVDCAIDSMSGLTSQPSMGAIVNSLAGTKLDTGIKPRHMLLLSNYWESTRDLYAPFESNMRYCSSDVYQHEMPGGQYTNLKFQAASLGLGDSWGKVQQSYAAANRALGDIVKVTPSSKVVGDLAQFMVQNDLDEHSLVEKADTLSFPGSVVEFMQGYIGQPSFGFPEPLRSKILKGKPTIEGRPGASMPPMELDNLEARLVERYGKANVSPRDVLSAALYPKVFEEYQAHVLRYSDLIEKLPTRAFLVPLREDEEVEIELSKGVSTHIKLKAAGELQDSGKREVYFEANGVPRVVEVVDKRSLEALGKKAIREKADVGVLGSVGAPMAGSVIEVSVKAGQPVHAGQQLAVLSAMKMETAVCAPIAGVVTQVAVVKADNLDAGDLIVYIDAASPSAPPLTTIDGDPLAVSDGEATRPNTPSSNGSAGTGDAAKQPQSAAAQR
ncbi:hypothetical protein OEZ86_002911 [Tetradesmus obliquus]|nr:hypothetical protein OEZ86_002911 [Tetradesmus obliquus]